MDSLESLESPIGLEPDGAENTALSKLSKLSKLPKLSKLGKLGKQGKLSELGVNLPHFLPHSSGTATWQMSCALEMFSKACTKTRFRTCAQVG